MVGTSIAASVGPNGRLVGGESIHERAGRVSADGGVSGRAEHHPALTASRAGVEV